MTLASSTFLVSLSVNSTAERHPRRASNWPMVKVSWVVGDVKLSVWEQESRYLSSTDSGGEATRFLSIRITLNPRVVVGLVLGCC